MRHHSSFGISICFWDVGCQFFYHSVKYGWHVVSNCTAAEWQLHRGEGGEHQETGKTLNQNRLLFKDSFMLPLGILNHCQHTLINTNTHTHLCMITVSWMHQRVLPSIRKAQKRDVFLSLQLLCTSVWCDLCLGPFNLHPAENHREAQVYCCLSRRDS